MADWAEGGGGEWVALGFAYSDSGLTSIYKLDQHPGSAQILQICLTKLDDRIIGFGLSSGCRSLFGRAAVNNRKSLGTPQCACADSRGRRDAETLVRSPVPASFRESTSGQKVQQILRTSTWNNFGGAGPIWSMAKFHSEFS